MKRKAVTRKDSPKSAPTHGSLCMCLRCRMLRKAEQTEHLKDKKKK